MWKVFKIRFYYLDVFLYMEAMENSTLNKCTLYQKVSTLIYAIEFNPAMDGIGSDEAEYCTSSSICE
jgi:hypothetical protein